MQFLKMSEEVGAKLPFWYDKIEYLHMPPFDLE